MFERDARKIATYAQENADQMADVLAFVICTIRKPLKDTVGDMRNLRRQGEKASCLWGFKKAAWAYARENKDAIYADTMEIAGIADPERRERELVAYFAKLPGFGLVKGGFAAQLAFNVGGCLDMHNVERFGIRAADIKASAFKNAKTEETRTKRLDIYMDLVKMAGGCKALWDDWCAYLAAREPGRYLDADHVSRIHCEALGI